VVQAREQLALTGPHGVSIGVIGVVPAGQVER
jgi:hypothetical protein